MVVDNASPEIISQTKPEHLKYVRLYFRPRTPTEYCREGIRPIGQRELGSHCPIPVYFVFDTLQVLLKDETEFSNGNLAKSRVVYGASHQFFLSIPFDLVFHHGAILPGEDKEEIIFHRNAEVLVPDSMPLNSALRAIVCRSAAERQMLIHLLGSKMHKDWIQFIKLDERGPLFERKWTFVEDVVVVDDWIRFRFNPNTQTPGPFNVAFTYLEDGTDVPIVRKRSIPGLNQVLRIQVPNASKGVATLQLDDSLAFAGSVTISKTLI